MQQLEAEEGGSWWPLVGSECVWGVAASSSKNGTAGTSGASAVENAFLLPRKETPNRSHICGKKTLREKVAPHPLSPTMDHLLPLIDGGAHTKVNVACAHFACNCKRSNKGEAQLRLFG